MEQTIVTYEREKLYDEVWARPLCEVCVDYGISDVALGKICRALKIPLPYRGYFLAKGKRRKRVALPPLKPGDRSTIVVDKTPRAPPRAAPRHLGISDDVAALLDAAAALETIRVPTRLGKLHALVEHGIMSASWDEKRLSWGAPALLRPREARVLHAFIAALERVGATVRRCERWPSENDYLEAGVGESWVAFRLREQGKLDRSGRSGGRRACSCSRWTRS